MLNQSRPTPRRTRLGVAVIGLALSAGTCAGWAAPPPELAPLGTAPERPAADFDARVKYTVDGEQSGRFVISQNFGARFVLTDADHPALPPLAVTVTPVMYVGMAYDVQTELLRASGPEPGPRLLMRDGRIASARVDTANGNERGSVEVVIAVEARDIKAAQAAARPLSSPPTPPPAPPLPPTVPPPPVAPAAPTPPSGMHLRAGTVGASAAAQSDASVPHVLPGGAPPVYPAELSRRGVGGTVYLWVDVAANGSVTGAKIEASSGNGELDAAALEAVGSWRFRPALKDGKAVAGQVRVPVMFQPPAEATD